MSDVLTIIVTYDSADVIEDCLNSANESGLDQILVWDNSSSDETVEIVTTLQIPGLRLVTSDRNLGFGPAINRSMFEMDASKYVLLLNPDCQVSPQTIASLVSRLNENPKLGAVAPRMEYPDGSPGFAGGPWPTLVKECIAASRLDDLIPSSWQQSLAAAALKLRLLPSLTGYLLLREATGLTSCDWVSGFCLLLRGDAWSKIGGFDERYFLYFEDVDLCRRIRKKQYEIACDNDVSALHLESTSTGKHSKNRHYRLGLWTYLRIHGSTFERLVARCATKVI